MKRMYRGHLSPQLIMFIFEIFKVIHYQNLKHVCCKLYHNNEVVQTIHDVLYM